MIHFSHLRSNSRFALVSSKRLTGVFIGVLIIYVFQTQINLKKLNGFLSVFLILLIFSPFSYAYISVTQKDKRTDYLGKEIAQKMQLEWDKNFKEPVNVVLGNEWNAGNLSYHLNSRPAWEGFIENKKLDRYLFVFKLFFKWTRGPIG